MKGRVILFAGLLWLAAPGPTGLPAQVSPLHDPTEGVTLEQGGEHLRIETEHGPIHLWRPAGYDGRTAGMVIYIHGYFTSVDQAWVNDRLAEQFGDSGRNALFMAVEAPRGNYEDVSWMSFEDLLRNVENRTPFSLPHGPLVVVGHSGAYRTILPWLSEPRLQHVILLDGLYSGQPEFRFWLHPQQRDKPHYLVLVSNDTWRQSNRFAHHIYGAARRQSIPDRPSSFTLREIHARLLYLRSQYDHDAIVSSGKVIPLLLQISPLSTLDAVNSPLANGTLHSPLELPK